MFIIYKRLFIKINLYLSLFNLKSFKYDQSVKKMIDNKIRYNELHNFTKSN